MREQEIEDVVRVTMINHAKDSIELIISETLNQEFINEIKEAISITNNLKLVPSEIKYITELYIDFDLEPFNEKNKCLFTKGCDIIKVIGYKPRLKYSSSEKQNK